MTTIDRQEQRSAAIFNETIRAIATRPEGQFHVRKLDPNETALRLPTDRPSQIFDWETTGIFNSHLAQVIELPRPEAI